MPFELRRNATKQPMRCGSCSVAIAPAVEDEAGDAYYCVVLTSTTLVRCLTCGEALVAQRAAAEAAKEQVCEQSE